MGHRTYCGAGGAGAGHQGSRDRRACGTWGYRDHKCTTGHIEARGDTGAGHQGRREIRATGGGSGTNVFPSGSKSERRGRGLVVERRVDRQPFLPYFQGLWRRGQRDILLIAHPQEKGERSVDVTEALGISAYFFDGPPEGKGRSVGWQARGGRGSGLFFDH